MHSPSHVAHSNHFFSTCRKTANIPTRLLHHSTPQNGPSTSHCDLLRPEGFFFSSERTCKQKSPRANPSLIWPKRSFMTVWGIISIGKIAGKTQREIDSRER